MNISIDEFQRVCRLAKLLEIKAGVPVFATKTKDEGIELKAGAILTFSVKNGERDYTAIIQSKDIIAVIGAFATEQKEKPESKTDDTELVGLLPNFLTSALMSKWSKMTTTDRILMFQKTPNSEIYEVNVGKNPETGKVEMASYVKGNFMVKEANAAFLFDWSLEIHEISTSDTGVSVRGKINGWFSEYGKYLSRPATGYQERNKKIDAQQAQKGATTDAIKKGLSLFGFNSDVYSGEV